MVSCIYEFYTSQVDESGRGIAMAARRGLATPALRVWRERRMMKQYELAHAAGVSANLVCRAERGDVIAFETVRALAAALAVTPDELCAVAPVETAEAGV